ncbi:MAG: DUF2807 domain-containing protein, partial [Rhodoferax sp.]|uniref:GIN domain-containing protein n=1 Tax=Rhodoferax sp. TaxID=50421 RepID=UPI002620D684
MPTSSSPLKSIAALAIAGVLSLSGLPALAWDWTPGKVVLGSGQVSKTQRQLSGFKGLALELPASVEIVQGDTEGVLIETDDNIAPLIETVVEDGQLKIRPARRFTAFKTKTTRITINARTIDSISISGSGEVKAQKLQSTALATQIS